MEAVAADIDRDNFRVFLNDLDVDRTVNIYKALANLSEKAVNALNSKMSREFSTITDRMRPLMSYISDNSVKISNFLDKESDEHAVLIEKDPKILEFLEP